MSNPNPYDVLGVSKDADDTEIKKAFRKRSLELHPDRNQDKDTTHDFQELNACYDKIKTQDLRQKFEMESQFGGGMGGMGHGGGGGGDDFQDINHIFNMMFGGGMPGGMGGGMPGVHMHPGMMPGGMGGMPPGVRIFHGGVPGGMSGHHFFQQQQQQMQKPPAIIKSCEITMEQCFQGCSIPLEVERWSIENGVRGTKKEIIHINIPPGIDESEIIVLRDLGNSVDNQLRGDIKLSIQIKPHAIFQRHGLDLLYKKHISMKEALCGFAFEILHLNGKTLAINNQTNPTVISPQFRRTIPQMGIRREEGAVGNLVIEFHVEFPSTLTPEQIEKLKEIL